MHYRESPLFLQAGSVTAAYESRAEISSEATLDTDGTPITIGGNYQFASKPTVSYTPVEGKAYVQQFMSEISYDSFALLVRAGWPAQTLVSLLVERYTTESGEVLVNDHKSNSYSKFEDLLKKIQSVETQGGLRPDAGRVNDSRGTFANAFSGRCDVLCLAGCGDSARSSQSHEKV